jgi:hypothetical protein
MSSAVEFLKGALSEEGIDAEVDLDQRDDKMYIHITTDIFGNEKTFSYINVEREDAGSKQKQMARLALVAKRELAKEYSQRFNWKDKNVFVQPLIRSSVTCEYCGTELDIDIMDETDADFSYVQAMEYAVGLCSEECNCNNR